MIDIISVVAVIIAVCAGLVATLVLFSNHKHKFWERQGVPFIKPVPIFGNSLPAFTARKNFNKLVLDLYNDLAPHPFGGVMDFWMPGFYIRDPELLRRVMVKDFDHFVDHMQFDKTKSNKWISAILTQLEGKEWKDVRTVMTPTFTSGKMKRMFPLVKECCDEFVECVKRENIQEKQPLEAKELFTRFAMDVIASIAFGVECNSLKNKDAPFAKMGIRMQSVSSWRMMKFFVYMLFPGLAKLLRLEVFDKTAVNFFVDMVKSTIEYREKHSIKRNDFLQMMMEARSSETGSNQETASVDDDSQDRYYKDAEMNHKVNAKAVLSNDMIVSQCLLFLLAGFDTVSNALQYIAYSLAVNPDIQQKLHDHIEQVIAEHDGKVNYDAIHHMPYLDMVVSETLRLYPILPRIDRVCVERYQIPDTNVVLEKGQTVFIPIYGLHMDEKYFPNPEKFDPERFTAENKATRSPYVHQPFSHGPRNCIANRFALMELNLVLVLLLQKYVIKTAPKMIVPIIPEKTFVFKAKGGIWLDFEPRGTK